MHTVIFIKIGVHISLCLVRKNADILRKRPCGNAVNDAEINGLCPAALQARDLRKRSVKHLRCGHRMYILAACKRLLHVLVV